MFATVRSDLPYGTEVPVRYYHNGDTEHATVNGAQVLYQYDRHISNPYGLGEGEVLLVSPTHGLIVANTVDLDFTN